MYYFALHLVSKPRSDRSQGHIQLEFTPAFLLYSLFQVFFSCTVHVMRLNPPCSVHSLLFCVHSGRAASLWDQGGEAQPLPGAAAAVSPEAATCRVSGWQRAHQEEPGEVQHPRWEDKGDGIQGNKKDISFNKRRKKKSYSETPVRAFVTKQKFFQAQIWTF